MSTKAYDLINSLVPRLQAILVANGYATDAGASVVLGPAPRMPNEAFPFIRLTEIDAAADDAPPHRPRAKVRVQFVAEAFAQQALADSVIASGHDLIGDLKRALFGDPARDMNGGAIGAQLDGYRILPPDDGSDIVVAQVRGSFVFADNFAAP